MSSKSNKRGFRKPRRKQKGSKAVLSGSEMDGFSVTKSSIPSVVTFPIHNQRFKYNFATTESKGTDIVSMASLTNLIWYGTSSTTGRRLFGSVRLRGLKVMTLQSSVTIGFEWLGLNSPFRSLDATSSDAQPAEIVVRPGAQMFQNWWINPYQSGSNSENRAMFAVRANGAAMVLVDLEFTFQDSDNAVVPDNNITSIGVTTGQLYYNYLDNTTQGGPSAGTTNLIPFGYGSILQGWGWT